MRPRLENLGSCNDGVGEGAGFGGDGQTVDLNFLGLGEVRQHFFEFLSCVFRRKEVEHLNPKLFLGDWLGKSRDILKHLHGYASGFVSANAAKDAVEVSF